ncbi:MAG: 30S ribosomal protein S9 [Chitinophagales bacterium]|nr:30S ribosomal protein S9 [Chitinophagales bacterium]
MSTTNALGRRKAAVARVYLNPGSGKITVNGKDHAEYFTVNHLRLKVEQPLKTVGQTNQYDVTVNVQGGGIKGQADAVKLGIARALVEIDAELKPQLKAAHLMTRDSRVVERKKPGLRKARKRAQFSKR